MISVPAIRKPLVGLFVFVLLAAACGSDPDPVPDVEPSDDASEMVDPEAPTADGAAEPAVDMPPPDSDLPEQPEVAPDPAPVKATPDDAPAAVPALDTTDREPGDPPEPTSGDNSEPTGSGELSGDPETVSPDPDPDPAPNRTPEPETDPEPDIEPPTTTAPPAPAPELPPPPTTVPPTTTAPPVTVPSTTTAPPTTTTVPGPTSAVSPTRDSYNWVPPTAGYVPPLHPDVDIPWQTRADQGLRNPADPWSPLNVAVVPRMAEGYTADFAAAECPTGWEAFDFPGDVDNWALPGSICTETLHDMGWALDYWGADPVCVLAVQRAKADLYRLLGEIESPPHQHPAEPIVYLGWWRCPTVLDPRVPTVADPLVQAVAPGVLLLPRDHPQSLADRCRHVLPPGAALDVWTTPSAVESDLNCEQWAELVLARLHHSHSGIERTGCDYTAQLGVEWMQLHYDIPAGWTNRPAGYLCPFN